MELLDVPMEALLSAVTSISQKVCPPCHSVSLENLRSNCFSLFCREEAFFRKIKHRQDCECFSSCMYACSGACCELKVYMNFFLCNLPFTLPGSSWNVVNFLMCTLV
jgi:hypothetical protein